MIRCLIPLPTILLPIEWESRCIPSSILPYSKTSTPPCLPQKHSWSMRHMRGITFERKSLPLIGLTFSLIYPINQPQGISNSSCSISLMILPQGLLLIHLSYALYGDTVYVLVFAVI